MRRALLLLVMLAGLSLVVWSGVQNLRARRAAQQTQANRIVLVPDGSRPDASPDSPAADSPLKGKPAPAFTLVDLDGKKVSLADFKGHPLVINYWATYCEWCKFEMPWLEELSHTYAATGLKVVGIAFDTEVGVPTILKNVQKLGATYPILLSDAATEKVYLDNLPVLPVSFYVDRTGKVIEVTAGVGSKQQLEAMFKETAAAGAQ
ncbi:MAG TPA: TlpA disulfide reductase family protein [Acidobacteriaceae bacterium]|nr:TlpA disulfide reductase family protein [Acidobacteriaceae bacterium]